MDAEVLTKSVWYNRLATTYKSYLLQAAGDAIFVCVPQTASLATTNISIIDIENHILKSTGTRGEFESLNGKRATITGTEVICGAGYQQQLAVRILGTDRVVFSDGLPHSVGSGSAVPPRHVSLYFLSRPLEGGLAAPSSVQDIEHSSAMKMIAMLRASSESESVFKELQSVINDVKRELSDNPCEESLTLARDWLRRECLAASSALNATTLLATNAPPPLTPASRAASLQRQLLQVLECWCMDQLHETVMQALMLSCRAEISHLGIVLKEMAHSSQADLKIKAEFRCNLSPAIASLGLLRTSVTPLEKLHCIRDMSLTVQRCLERHLEDNHVDLADVEFATDDMLDMLLWVIIQGQFDQHTIELPAHLAYITRFHFAAEDGELEMSRLGYYVANVQQALGFFGLRFLESVAAQRSASAVSERVQLARANSASIIRSESLSTTTATSSQE